MVFLLRIVNRRLPPATLLSSADFLPPLERDLLRSTPMTEQERLSLESHANCLGVAFAATQTPTGDSLVFLADRHLFADYRKAIAFLAPRIPSKPGQTVTSTILPEIGSGIVLRTYADPLCRDRIIAHVRFHNGLRANFPCDHLMLCDPAGTTKPQVARDQPLTA